MHQQPDGAIGSAEQSVDDGGRTVLIQIRRFGVLFIGVARSHKANPAITGKRIIHQLDRTGLPDGQWYRGLRIDDQAAQGQDGQQTGEFRVTFR